MAWAFAQYLMCAKPTEEDSCGQCPSCLKSAKLSHPDLHWVFPVVTGRGTHPTSDMFLSDWREFLEKNLFLQKKIGIHTSAQTINKAL